MKNRKIRKKLNASDEASIFTFIITKISLRRGARQNDTKIQLSHTFWTKSILNLTKNMLKLNGKAKYPLIFKHCLQQLDPFLNTF